MLSATLLLAASMVVGQAEEPNVEYEKLKVLQPIIGTWHATGTNEENGNKWEALITYSWPES